MTTLHFAKVNALPVTLAPDTVYYVKTGTVVRQYISNSAGTAATLVGPEEPIEPLMLLGVNND